MLDSRVVKMSSVNQNIPPSSEKNSSAVSRPQIKEWYPHCVVYDPIQAGSIDGTDTVPHDKAVIRACNSTYRPPTLDTDPKCTLFIARLNKNTRESDIESTFSAYGEIVNVKLVCDIVTGFSKRYAFVTYARERSCIEAIRAMNRSDFQGATILVDFECARVLPGWKPRRLGGGFGGNKNSGQLRFGGRNKPFVKPVVLMSERELAVWRRQGGGEGWNGWVGW